MITKSNNDIVPKNHYYLIVCSVKRLCPDLPENNQTYIMKALRNNYLRKGRVYKKIISGQALTLPELYSAYVAYHRHTHTDYSYHYSNPQIQLFKKFYNNHSIAVRVFGKYADEVKEITKEMWGR